MDCLKVSSKSSPASVAGAIAGMVKDGVPVNIQCVGAGAVNQAIKAVAIARGCSPTSSLTGSRALRFVSLSTFTRLIGLLWIASSWTTLSLLRKRAICTLVAPMRPVDTIVRM